MNIIAKFFTIYDHFLYQFSPHLQALISLVIILGLILSIFQIIKKPSVIFLIVLLVLLPGGVSALKILWQVVAAIVKYLFVRVQLNL